LTIWLAALALGATGCGDDDENVPEEESPEEHVCERAGDDGVPITASANRADAPEVEHSDLPYQVTLVAGAPSYLMIAGGEDGLLFTKATGVVIGLFFEEESANQLAPPTPNEFCATDLPEHFDLALEASPGNWYIQLAPGAIPDVWLALTEATGHTHEE
jgi:hypothetical protein